MPQNKSAPSETESLGSLFCVTSHGQTHRLVPNSDPARSGCLSCSLESFCRPCSDKGVYYCCEIMKSYPGQSAAQARRVPCHFELDTDNDTQKTQQ